MKSILKKPNNLIIPLAISSLAFSSDTVAAEKKQDPNILIINADDMGWHDLKINNPKSYIDTPNIDRLAKMGSTLTNCYASAPMCSPSRAGLLTGRSPFRLGVQDWIKEKPKKPLSNVHLLSDEITIAEVLKKAGYQTAISGKWHLNNSFRNNNGSDPDEQGFDYWFATVCQSEPTHKNPTNFWLNGKALGTIKGYSCNLVVDRAIGWLKKTDKKKPFLLYTAFHEAHVVCAAPEKIVNKYLKLIEQGKIPLMPKTGKKGLGQAEYYACIENMDIAIGELLDYLESTDQIKNTIIMFTADNGPDSNRKYKGRLQSVGDPGPLKGRKKWIFEGGIRVPGIIYWPNITKANKKIDTPVSQLDLLPTICANSSAKLPTDRVIDGTDVTKILAGTTNKRSKPLHWHFYASPGDAPNSVIRDGDWILCADWTGKNRLRGRFDPSTCSDIKSAELTNYRLYNIKKDIHQDKDVKSKNSKIFKRLKGELIKLHKSARDESPIWQKGNKSKPIIPNL